MKRIAALSFLVAVLAATSLAQTGGGQGRRGGQFGRGNQNSLIGLLRREDVQAELKITDDQKAKIAEASPRGGGFRQGGGGGAGGGGQQLTPEQRQAQMAEQEKKVTDLLDEGQRKRLHELYVQRVGTAAIVRADVQAALGLTDDQKAKVKEIQAKQQEANRTLMEKARNNEIDRAQVGETMQKNEKILKEEYAKLLTKDQAGKLKAMEGAKFTFKDPTDQG